MPSPLRDKRKRKRSASMRETPSRQRQTRSFGIWPLIRPFEADPANSRYTTRIHPAPTSFARRSLRHAGACLPIWGPWRSLPSWASRFGTSCRIPWRWNHRPRQTGARPLAWRRRSPSASSIRTIKHRLIRFSGTPKGVARTCSAGPTRTRIRRRARTLSPGSEQAGPAIAAIAARMDPRGIEAAGVIDDAELKACGLRHAGALGRLDDGQRRPASARPL
jgi:hypothetical protein